MWAEQNPLLQKPPDKSPRLDKSLPPGQKPPVNSSPEKSHLDKSLSKTETPLG